MNLADLEIVEAKDEEGVLYVYPADVNQLFIYVITGEVTFQVAVDKDKDVLKQLQGYAIIQDPTYD